jgi:hypothetical protein
MILVFAVVVCLSAMPVRSPAQEEDGRDWEDIVKDALRDAIEDDGSGDLGEIWRIEVAGRGSSSVELDVDVRRVSDPGRVAFQVEVYDDDLRTIEDMAVSWGAIPDSKGRVVIEVTYTGDGEVNSVGAKVSLVDRDSGRTSSRRKVALPWQWLGTGTGVGSSLTGAADSDALTTRDSGTQEAPRETRIVELDPVRVGDTPKPQELQVATGVIMQAERAPTPKPTPAASFSHTIATARVVTQTVDLYASAPKATWKSDRGSLPFNGSTNDDRGFVRQLGSARLIDGKTYKNVLQTHPAWIDGGHISGSYSVTIPPKAVRFEAKAGFLAGVDRSDGVRATVRLAKGSRGTTLAERVVHPKHGVVSISGEIPESARGQQINLVLSVQAAGTSTQDWFVWVEPVVR